MNQFNVDRTRDICRPAGPQAEVLLPTQALEVDYPGAAVDWPYDAANFAMGRVTG